MVKKLLHFGISLALMGVCLYWAFKGVDATQLWAAMGTMSIPWTVVFVVTMMATLVIRGCRWVLLMRPFAPEVSVASATLALAIGYTTSVFVPRSGEAMRALSLKWRCGTLLAPVLATVLVERILDIIWLVLLLGLSLLFMRERINEVFPVLEPLSLVALAVSVLLLATLLLLSHHEKAVHQWTVKLLTRLSPRLADAIGGMLATFLQGLEALRTTSLRTDFSQLPFAQHGICVAHLRNLLGLRIDRRWCDTCGCTHTGMGSSSRDHGPFHRGCRHSNAGRCRVVPSLLWARSGDAVCRTARNGYGLCNRVPWARHARLHACGDAEFGTAVHSPAKQNQGISFTTRNYLGTS